MSAGHRQEQTYRVGDTVRDGDCLAVVTDIRANQYFLRPAAGPMSHEWSPEDPDLLVLVRRG